MSNQKHNNVKKIVKKASGKAKAAKKAVAKKPIKKAKAKKSAKVAKAVKVPGGITSKEVVAKFLEGKSFPNSREAGRAFRKENPTVKIQQAYFYTLFASFGTRTKKKDGILSLIKTGDFKNCMAGYHSYKSSVVAPEKPVAFTYFLNLWKKEKGLTGPIRAKATPKVKAKAKKAVKPVKVAKKVKKVTPKVIAPKVEVVAEVPATTVIIDPAKHIELSKMSAKEILVKTEELLKDEAKTISTDLKNKGKIVKEATALLTANGYTVA